MRRLSLMVVAVAVITAATALAVAFAGSREAAAAKSSLTITYWSQGTSGQSVKSTLRCGPAGGTLHRPARACAKLKAGGAKLFAPTSPKAACTMIWGGPEVARLKGSLAGKRVAATLDRTDGCAISRWDALAPWLVPPGGA